MDACNTDRSFAEPTYQARTDAERKHPNSKLLPFLGDSTVDQEVILAIEDSRMSGCGCEIEIKDKSETRVLVILLLINGLMFLVEFGVGWWAESTALIADAMDMLADAMVYSVGLYAVGKSVSAKIQAASLSGWLQIGLGLLVLADIVRRFVYGSEPVSTLMMVMGLVALIANTICLILISKHRDGEVHMRASWIFSKNDVIANVGVIFAGVLVATTASRIPDLVIGIMVAGIVIRGGIIILKDARKENATRSCFNSS